MPVVLKTMIDGNPHTVGLRRDNLRDRLTGLQIDNAQISITQPTEEDLIVLEEAIMRLRHCWVINGTGASEG